MCMIVRSAGGLLLAKQTCGHAVHVYFAAIALYLVKTSTQLHAPMVSMYAGHTNKTWFFVFAW